MRSALRSLALALISSLAACSGGATLTPIAGSSAQNPLAPSSLTPLPRAQQDAIRASTPGDPRWLADLSARRRIGAARHDRWYAMTTHGNRGRAAQSTRARQTVYALTTCITTYLNVSGTYDTSTDPIVGQFCDTTYLDDGGMGIGDNGGGDVALPPLDENLYGEPSKNFDTKTEQACKVGAKVTFISVSKWSNDTLGAPSPGHTECGPKDDSSILAVAGGRLYPFPGGCNFMVILTAHNISVNPVSGNEGMLTQTSTADGIRINGNCSFDFVRI